MSRKPAGGGGGGGEAVKVYVRVRPFNPRELDAVEKSDSKELRCVVTMKDSHCKVLDLAKGGDAVKHAFHFDACIWSIPKEVVAQIKNVKQAECNDFMSQQQVYGLAGTQMVENVLSGYNACLFAYGQTGSGKTHTMMGKRDCPEMRGIIPRLCRDLLAKTTAQKAIKFKITISYIEIYNEMVRDLLTPKRRTDSLRVRQDPVTGTYVEDLSVHDVVTEADILKLMSLGDTHRTVAETKMNHSSSRSHAIFKLNVSQIPVDAENEKDGSKSSKLNLVDLAGSERVASSGAEGINFKEATKINLSLSTLGRVIDALADLANSVKGAFPPYRDSMLTWILSDSLGGNSKTAMIAAVSPSELNLDETINTLRYAARAREIVNIAVVNEDSSVAKIKELEAKIDFLRKQVREAGGATMKLRLQEVEEKCYYQEDKMSKLEKERDALIMEKRERLESQAKRKDRDDAKIKKLESQANKKVKDVSKAKEDTVELKKDLFELKEKLKDTDKKLKDQKEKLKDYKESAQRDLKDAKAEVRACGGAYFSQLAFISTNQNSVRLRRRN